MRFSRIAITALRALSRNKTRAILTTLGIVIGIAAVIAMVELGRGSSVAINKTIASMGANSLIIVPGTAASGGVSYGAGTVMTLTPEDSAALAREAPSLSGSAPIVRSRSQAIYSNKNWVPQYIIGTTPQYLQVRDWTTLDLGEMFTEQDVRTSAKVCIIGATIMRELFGGEDPIGKELRVQNVALKVIGVLSSKGASMMGMDQDDIIVAPWTTIKFRISATSTANTSSSSSSSTQSSLQTGSNSLYPASGAPSYPGAVGSGASSLRSQYVTVDQIQASAKSAEDIERATEEINQVLGQRHRIKPDEAPDFTVRSMTEMTSALTSTSSLMTNLLLGVALLSLVVGGVGIMNIMLVSVTERTREIGLRMAVGARASDILRQFLVEAVVLCLCGGIIGILFGRGVSFLVAMLLKWPTESSLTAVISAVLVSAAVGILFGFYPAWKASKLDPIEALRYE